MDFSVRLCSVEWSEVGSNPLPATFQSAHKDTDHISCFQQAWLRLPLLKRGRILLSSINTLSILQKESVCLLEVQTAHQMPMKDSQTKSYITVKGCELFTTADLYMAEFHFMHHFTDICLS